MSVNASQKRVKQRRKLRIAIRTPKKPAIHELRIIAPTRSALSAGAIGNPNMHLVAQVTLKKPGE